MAATYVPIQSVTLASSAASVTFSSIPQTFTDLVLRFSPSFAGSMYAYWEVTAATFSGNGSAVYSYTTLGSNGTSKSSSRVADWYDVFGGAGPGGLATANTCGSSEMYMPNYTSSDSKPLSAIGISEINASTENIIRTGAGLFRSTAITSITLSGATYAAGSTFHLYGIKNS